MVKIERVFGSSTQFQGPANKRRIAGKVVLVMFSLLITSALQNWIGQLTIYAQPVQEARLALHNAILHNKLPNGASWESLGARSTNMRIGTVLLAEGLHVALNVDVERVYFALDTIFLFLFLVLLHELLRFWVDESVALIAWLFVISILPLTYFFHYFHPWDRLSQVLWTMLLISLKSDRFFLFVLVSFTSGFVKFDTLFAPVLYFLTKIGREPALQLSIRTAGLCLISVGTFAFLATFAPDENLHAVDASAMVHGVVAILRQNFYVFRNLNWAYPPLIVHSLPIIFALYGWKQTDRVGRAGVIFGIVFLIPSWLAASNFQEVRAQVPLIIVLLPAAACGLRRLLIEYTPRADSCR